MTNPQIFNGEKLKISPLSSGARQECLHSPPLLNILEVLTKEIRQEKKKKVIKTGKKEVKLSLFVDDMIPYQEILRTLHKKKNKFSNAAGYKSNIQKSTVFLYTHNEWEEKVKNKSLLKLHQKSTQE